MLRVLRYLLFPIVPIYYAVTWLRNKLYDSGFKKSTAYAFPVLCVGNLSVGGTGKTPMIEYLIRLLKPKYRVATLSRGYKRQTSGFIIATKEATASTIGDEPLQFYQKFEDIVVGVDADRAHGISQLMALKDPPEVILLDDAYQHRKVKAGFNILLTSFDHLYTKDMVLPTGNLREPQSGAHRADLIVVTKCPANLTEGQKQGIKNSIKALRHQQVFFAHISYSEHIKNKNREISLKSLKDKPFTLVTGIADPTPLVAYLKTLDLQFEHLNFKDHHDFSLSEIALLKQKSLLVTTEKDMMRLRSHFDEQSSIYYLPIEMVLDRPLEFDALVTGFVK